MQTQTLEDARRLIAAFTDQPEDVEFLRDALRDDADAFCDYAPVEQEPIWRGITRKQVFILARARCEKLLDGLDTEE